MKNKEFFLKPKRLKLIVAIMIIVVYVVSFCIRLTPLIKIYEVAIFTTLIMQNTINCLIIVCLLITIYRVENKLFIEKRAVLENLEEKGN